MRLSRLAAFCLVLALSPRLLADDARTPVADPERQAADLEKEIFELFDAKKYPEAAEKCRAEMALVPKNYNPPYNLACALARMGKKDEALAALAKSVELGFEDPDHLKVDEDLASLREEKAFAELVAKAVENDRKADEGTYDPGVAAPGVKFEDRAPEGGLKYRLLLPETAGAEKPARLLVWLHPSGASKNSMIQAQAPSWMKAGYAVLVPTQKRWRGWTDAEAAKLLDKSVPDAGTVAGVDAKRPVLIGFSAGAQMALVLWSKDPARLGGVVVDAGYPMDLDAWQRGEQKFLEPAEGAKGTPMLVFVGTADEGHMAWKMKADHHWKAAGLPLTMDYVEGGKHEWLIRGERDVALTTWLAEVAAGKLPGVKVEPSPTK